jgi:dynein heavy chain
MRALRDFNTPKIVIDDIPIFMGLRTDLFSGCESEPGFDAKVKAACEACARDPNLCAPFGFPLQNIRVEEKFIEKCVELSDLLNVHHSVFIIGFPGSAKSTVWKLLARACSYLGKEKSLTLLILSALQQMSCLVL